MSSKGFLRAGFCAFSLSVSLVAGCASPVVPTPATGGEVPAPAAQAPTEGTPAGQPAPTAPAPAAVTPVTLSGNASFRGEALSGYDVTVLDAQTGKAVERKADLAGVTTLAVLDKNLKTDATGAFSFQVVGLKPGQALRVQIRQGKGLLETIVTSDLQALGAKKMQLLQANAGDGLSINELTTAIAKIARGVLLTTQVLTPEAAAPVLAQLATEMAALSAKLDTAMKANPNLANGLVSTEGKESDAMNALVSSAGALKEVTQAVANLVSQVAKSSTSNAAAAASDPAVMAQLATVQFIGTVLTGSFANNNFSLSNSATGQKVDAASGDVGSMSSNVSGSGSSSSSNGLSQAQSDALALLNNTAFNLVTTANQQAVLDILKDNKATFGLSEVDWTLMIQMNAYVVPNPAAAFDKASGRQQSVAKYLLERIHQRKTGGTKPYASLSELQTDFSYAVNKEVTKWRLISKMSAATTPANVVTAMNDHLDDLRADFANYLTWHVDWTVDNADWAGNWRAQETYFAQNISNLDTFKANASMQTAVATQILATPKIGQSDIAILDGLAVGLMSHIALTAPATDTSVLTSLKANKTWLGLESADWDQLLKLSVYATTGGVEDFTNSGRQKAVAQYLRERVTQRKTNPPAVFPYMSAPALKADFHYAVAKETAKWNLIIAIAEAKADNNNTAKAITALDTYLPTIKADFANYLTWHADWEVPAPAAPWMNGWSGQVDYFATNNTNIGLYQAATTGKTTIASNVLQASNGVSDMAILNGLRPTYVSAIYRVLR